MFTESQLKTTFENKYVPETWTAILRANFNANKLHKKPIDITSRIKSNEYKAKAIELGSMETLEGHLIGLYEVDVPLKAQLHRNRKGLRDLLTDVYRNDVDAALVIFVQGEKWRFTYVSEISTRDTDGKRRKRSTDPKRYTYLFGKGEKAKTAAQQFAKIKIEENLLEKGIRFQALNDFFNVDKMSKAFFDEYRQHYGKFTAYITGEDENQKKIGKASPLFKSTFNSQAKEARDFVKKMLGRIVFLYFLEKKGWLGVPLDEKWGDGDVNFLSNLFKTSKDQEAFYSNVLAPLFFTALNTKRTDDVYKLPNGEKVKIPFLNGGLFEEDDDRTQLLQFPKKLFSDLFDFFDRYNFTVYEDSPDEHTVAVDPEMLGHIFENLLEDNKDKGAYYTPKEIVHYMCQESLIEYLYSKINPGVKAELDNTGKAKAEVLSREALQRFIKNHEALGINNYEERILEALRDVKVCDPAIGSGAFPMGVLMEIYYAVETLFYLAPDTVNAIWKLGNNNQLFNAAKVKESIIQNSVYGVDIEQGAVDIARLRFWLSLVVDEDIPKPLPNLDYKIVVGNSLLSKFDDELIDIEWSYTLSHGTADTKALIATQVLKLQTLEVWQEAYFNKNGDKQKQQQDIRNIKIDILINQLTLSKLSFKHRNPKLGGFAPTAKDIQKNLENELTLANYDKTIKKLELIRKDKKASFDFFDWKLDFPEIMNDRVNKTIGFDIVIANPPYLNFKMYSSEDRVDLKKIYPEIFDGKADLYYYFFICACRLMKGGGFASMITSRYWIEAEFAAKLRQNLAKSTTLVEIVDFKNVTVFDGIGIKTGITSFKNIATSNYQFYYRDHPGKKIDTVNLDEFESIPIPKANIEKVSWVLKDAAKSSLISKIERGTILLSDIANCKQGIVTGLDKAFISTGKDFSELPKKLRKTWIKVGDIHRYQLIPVEKRELVYTNAITNLSDFPKLKARLIPFKEKLSKRREAANGKIRWFDLQWARDPKIFDSEKLICRFKASENTFCYDFNSCYSSADTTVVSLKDKTEVKLKYLLGLLNSKLLDFYFKSYGKLMDYRYEYYPGPVGNMRIKISKQQEEIVTLVDAIIKNKNLGKATEKLEKKIDLFVYKLYELDYSEACLIEGNNHWISKEAYDEFSVDLVMTSS